MSFALLRNTQSTQSVRIVMVGNASMNHFVSKICLSLFSAHTACISFLDVALAFDVKRDKYCI
jgi:hypothetical protein